MRDKNKNVPESGTRQKAARLLAKLQCEINTFINRNLPDAQRYTAHIAITTEESKMNAEAPLLTNKVRLGGMIPRNFLKVALSFRKKHRTCIFGVISFFVISMLCLIAGVTLKNKDILAVGIVIGAIGLIILTLAILRRKNEHKALNGIFKECSYLSLMFEDSSWSRLRWLQTIAEAFSVELKDIPLNSSITEPPDSVNKVEFYGRSGKIENQLLYNQLRSVFQLAQWVTKEQKNLPSATNNRIALLIRKINLPEKNCRVSLTTREKPLEEVVDEVDFKNDAIV